MTKKKAATNNTPTPPIQPVIPQLTFTEAEHHALINFKTFITKFARFNNLDEKSIHEYAKINIETIMVIKKIGDHIFEFKRKLNSMPKG